MDAGDEETANRRSLMFRGIRAVGVCAGVAFAMLALSASAFAVENVPGYGKCVAKAGGVYANSGCTKIKAGTNTYEWQALTVGVPFKGKKETGTGNAVLESASGTEISCTGQTANGEFGPGNQVKGVIGEFTGCKALGAACNSEGQPAEHINTKPLHGEPGVVKKELKEEKNIDGNDLKGATSETAAEFTCGPAPAVVRSGIVTKVQADSTGGTSGEFTNKMEQKLEVEYVAEKPGKQVPSEWIPNGGGITHSVRALTTEHLEASIAGAGFEASGFSLTDVEETTSKTVKVELRQCEHTITC
jgi:hypothetical protein